MNEISVVTDVRMSPDSPELILVRQKVALVDGELRAVGGPVAANLSLLFRRVALDVRWELHHQLGASIVLTVKNTGSLPLRMVDATFECRERSFITAQGHPAGAAGWHLRLLPVSQSKASLMLPGDSHDWYLPFNSDRAPIRSVLTAPHDRYKIVVSSELQFVGEVSGERLEPLFGRLEDGLQPYIADPLRSVVAALPPEVRERLTQSLRPLYDTPFEKWGDLPGLHKIDDSLFLLTVEPDYRVLLRRYKRGGIELVDVARTADRHSVVASPG